MFFPLLFRARQKIIFQRSDAFILLWSFLGQGVLLISVFVQPHPSRWAFISAGFILAAFFWAGPCARMVLLIWPKTPCNLRTMIRTHPGNIIEIDVPTTVEATSLYLDINTCAEMNTGSLSILIQDNCSWVRSSGVPLGALSLTHHIAARFFALQVLRAQYGALASIAMSKYAFFFTLPPPSAHALISAHAAGVKKQEVRRTILGRIRLARKDRPG